MDRKGKRRSRVLGLAALVAVGCATSYRPKPDPCRIVVGEWGGDRYYVRDQITWQDTRGFGPPRGTGLVLAVRGVPEAESAALTYYRRKTARFMLLGGAVACMELDAIYALDRGEIDTASKLLAGACGAMALIGVVVGYTADSYMFRAVNEYNSQRCTLPSE